MRLTCISQALRQMFRNIISANEVGGNLSLAYVFSDPDGVRSGKSGWSFGICQYDVSNNPNAILALREMGFTTDEIKGIKDQSIQIYNMNRKLMDHKDIVDKWDLKQINECLFWPLELCNEIGVDFDRAETFLHISDYHNQLNFSRGGKLYTWLQNQKVSVTPQMILEFKYTIPWGISHRDDVDRRYKIIMHVTNA